MTQLLVVNGFCRENGVIDSAVKVAVETASEAGATIEVTYLRDFPIEFYRNCRQCTQVPGEAPGACIQQDCMHELVDKIEASDGYILASPTNFYFPDKFLFDNRCIQKIHGKANSICLLAVGIPCSET